MKAINFLFVSVLFALQLQGQSDIPISSEVKSVTVYPRGAQVERVGSKFLTAGRHVLTFTGLASELDPTSISVSAGQNVSVLSVSSQTNHLRESTKPKHVKMLEDSLSQFEFDHQFNQNMLGVYTEERKMILANQKVNGNETGLIIEDLEDLSDFYRDRLADIMLKEMEIQTKQKSLSDRIKRLKAQLAEHNAKLNRSTGEIFVEVNVPTNGNASFELVYMVQNAGWVPSYNVNVAEVNQPLQVSYNAKVFQNTGVDWNGVQLTLTNANPGLTGTKPELHPWRLYFIENPVMMRGARSMSNKAYEMAEPQNLAVTVGAEMLADDGMGYTIEYPANEAVTQFKITTKHNVPSNGKPQAINIDVFTVPAAYEYYVAPKLDPTAFLVAKVAGFEQYELLPGEANLFLANTFVGKTYLDPSTVADSLELSLGRDQSIIVKREKIKDFALTRKIGNSTKESLGIEISVRNGKSAGISLVIEDQIPITTDKEIEVSLQEASGAKHDSNTGTLRWKKQVAPGSTEKVQFKYEVKYPSDRKINL